MVVKDEHFARELMELLNNDLTGLNDVYKDIADEIGIENALSIFKLFHGTQISFPNRLFSKEHIYRAIANEYNGNNIPQLAQKYNYSERSVWRILKSMRKEGDSEANAGKGSELTPQPGELGKRGRTGQPDRPGESGNRAIITDTNR